MLNNNPWRDGVILAALLFFLILAVNILASIAKGAESAVPWPGNEAVAGEYRINSLEPASLLEYYVLSARLFGYAVLPVAPEEAVTATAECKARFGAVSQVVAGYMQADGRSGWICTAFPTDEAAHETARYLSIVLGVPVRFDHREGALLVFKFGASI